MFSSALSVPLRCHLNFVFHLQRSGAESAEIRD